ncbi:MAG: bile acid:sodium symporter family protein, partial [Mariprofundaceae bacterium]|nr:bile acid:sodium symporter family protein [Mariprofundaceae bacterium]
VVLNGLGYLLGWGAARAFGFDHRHRITMAIEIGMQNAGLGVALALKHFEPITALPGALFAVWCILTAAGMTRYLHKRNESVAAV